MRTVARCKRCGTEFPLEGEVSGCPNCQHGELECFPKDPIEEMIEGISNEELVAFAEDMAKTDEDPFMTELMEHNTVTQAFLEELNAELDQIELPERKDGGETPYEKGQRLIREGRSPLRDGSAFTAAQGFSMDECISCSNDCEGCEHEATLNEAVQETTKKEPTTKQKKISRAGHCRTCQRWKKLSPQYGACDVKSGPRNITVWCDACPSYWHNSNYAAQQVEIREKRKAHDSILRAMERSRG